MFQTDCSKGTFWQIMNSSRLLLTISCHTKEQLPISVLNRMWQVQFFAIFLVFFTFQSDQETQLYEWPLDQLFPSGGFTAQNAGRHPNNGQISI